MGQHEKAPRGGAAAHELEDAAGLRGGRHEGGIAMSPRAPSPARTGCCHWIDTRFRSRRAARGPIASRDRHADAPRPVAVLGAAPRPVGRRVDQGVLEVEHGIAASGLVLRGIRGGENRRERGRGPRRRGVGTREDAGLRRATPRSGRLRIPAEAREGIARSVSTTISSTRRSADGARERGPRGAESLGNHADPDREQEDQRIRGERASSRRLGLSAGECAAPRQGIVRRAAAAQTAARTASRAERELLRGPDTLITFVAQRACGARAGRRA